MPGFRGKRRACGHIRRHAAKVALPVAHAELPSVALPLWRRHHSSTESRPRGCHNSLSYNDLPAQGFSHTVCMNIDRRRDLTPASPPRRAAPKYSGKACIKLDPLSGL